MAETVRVRTSVCTRFFIRAVSGLRKLRLIFRPNSGLRFPKQVDCGNYDPELLLRTGYAFPNRSQPEAAFQFGASKRDELSA